MASNARLDAVPPFAKIHRLVEYVLKHEGADLSERTAETGGSPDHIAMCAFDVQSWLDANLMTEWSQEMMAGIEGW
jgi:hypothetical protein